VERALMKTAINPVREHWRLKLLGWVEECESIPEDVLPPALRLELESKLRFVADHLEGDR
jgi:hypothetical protein